MIYKCKKDVQFDSYDDDGFYTEGSIVVNEGEMFERSSGDYRIIGGEVRLDGIGRSEGKWLEISETSLSLYFEKVSEGEAQR